MTPRAVFFDLDDTLLDGFSAMEASWEVVCAEAAPGLGCKASALREAIRREGARFWKDEALVGHWRVRLAEAREHTVGLALAAEGWDVSAAHRIAARYGEEHRARLALFDDAVATLRAVRGAGLRLGLITNGPRELQRDKIARFGLEQHVDVIVIEGEFGQGKPEPAVFRHAAACAGVATDAAWHVGDNLYADVGGAQSVGMHAVWINRGRWTPESMPVAPDRTVASLGELRGALGL